MTKHAPVANSLKPKIVSRQAQELLEWRTTIGNKLGLRSAIALSFVSTNPLQLNFHLERPFREGP
jgi:hypothetical protein